MSETTPQASERGRLRSKLTTSAAKRTALALIVLAALIGGFSFLRSGAFSAVLPKPSQAADEIVIAPRSMSFWVNATGTLRASSVRNFSAPPPFGEYWQFQIVSLAPEGGNVKTGDALINFDAQKVREDLQRYQSELDQANKELEKTKVSIDLERQELSSSPTMVWNYFTGDSRSMGRASLSMLLTLLVNSTSGYGSSVMVTFWSAFSSPASFSSTKHLASILSGLTRLKSVIPTYTTLPGISEYPPKKYPGSL